MSAELRAALERLPRFTPTGVHDGAPMAEAPDGVYLVLADVRAILALASTSIDGVSGTGLDPEALAAAMNDFELKADLSAIVDTNLGTHRADCAHVGWIADAYQRVTAPRSDA